LGRSFARDMEAILGLVQLGAQLGETYIYPHEVRENLRLVGMRLDRSLPQLQNPWAPPPDHEPDWGEPIGNDEDIDLEEEPND
jgi:hypothetical protein